MDQLGNIIKKLRSDKKVPLRIVAAYLDVDHNILEKHQYPWHIPCSFRNYIIYGYHGIKMERIYYATQDLDELQKQITSILASEF